MTIPEASPIEQHRPTRPMSGGRKALLILAAGCGGALMLVLTTCGVGVGIGIFQAMLPPQVEVTYRGGNSEFMQLVAKNTSGRPLTDVVVHATWHIGSGKTVASAKAILRGTIASGEERSFDLRPVIDESKLNETTSVRQLYTPEQWDSMSRSERETAILRIAKVNRAVEQANNVNLDEAFSKPPRIKVNGTSGEEVRSKLIDRSK